MFLQINNNPLLLFCLAWKSGSLFPFVTGHFRCPDRIEISAPGGSVCYHILDEFGVSDLTDHYNSSVVGLLRFLFQLIK